MLPGLEDTKIDQAKLVRAQKYELDRKKETHSIYINFRTIDDVIAFSKTLGIDISEKTKQIHFPIQTLFEESQGISFQTKSKIQNKNESWRKSWKEMPDFIQNDNPPFKQITVILDDKSYLNQLANLIDHPLTEKTKSIWFPKLERDDNARKRWVIPNNINELKPKYPIYIVSKGRWVSRCTAKSLERMKQPYYIVVEEQEYENYLKETNSEYGTVLVLDNQYKMNYDLCDDLGLTKSTGPGPARNFAWDHSISIGATSHWVMDDNITDFYRLHLNQRIRVERGVCFRVCEDFVDRYTNIPVSGLQYRFFIAPNSKYPPYAMNTRIYSCLLIRNDCKFKWRGRYNEDTDLSLRVLKDGDCTLQFNAFLQGKAATQTLSGGNTDEFYAVEDQDDDLLHGTSNKSDMQLRLHPDVSKNVWKYGRWHHYVDYNPFKINKLVMNPGLKFSDVINNYGMEYITNYLEE